MGTSPTKPLRLADRMSRLGTESAFEVLARARQLEAQGKQVIHLEIGEPDFPTPPHIVEAAVRALREGWTHYGPSPGLPQLREAVAEFESRYLGVPFDPAEVIITPGGKPIMFYAILALVNQQDEVLYPNPGFPIYESVIEFVGGQALPYGFREDQDFAVDMDELLSKITDRTKLIILNSPGNPTGGVMTREELAILAKALVDRNVYILSECLENRPFFGLYFIAAWGNIKRNTP